ncbi:MAG: SIR2 family protein [Planctomycetes bacterium]|nr:SIR2 family protein [Planctomycetota bacterium]
MFTTNIDLCVEAAMVRLSQRPRPDRRPDLVLVDGFESAILPTFNMGCYTRATSTPGNRCALYYWKLHGSVDWTYAQPLKGTGGEEGEGFSDRSIIVRRVDGKLWADLAECGALHAKATAEDQPIVIFPTPAKYSQTYTFPYMDMFEAFRRTLEEVELLICVGTSFPDQHIRSAVRSFVERDNTLLFVVDPQVTGDTLRSLFGESRSVQPVIGMGFEEFVKEFRALEAVAGSASVAEKKP